MLMKFKLKYVKYYIYVLQFIAFVFQPCFKCKAKGKIKCGRCNGSGRVSIYSFKLAIYQEIYFTLKIYLSFIVIGIAVWDFTNIEI